jgi:hypothetical protein
MIGISDPITETICNSEHPAFHQRSDRFLDEQRRSLRALDDESTQLCIGRIVAQQGPDELVGSVGFERIKMDCREVVLAGPFGVVLQPTSQNHEQTAGPDAVYQALDHILCLDIRPLHVLEPQQKRTIFGAAQE